MNEWKGVQKKIQGQTETLFDIAKFSHRREYSVLSFKSLSDR